MNSIKEFTQKQFCIHLFFWENLYIKNAKEKRFCRAHVFLLLLVATQNGTLCLKIQLAGANNKPFFPFKKRES